MFEILKTSIPPAIPLLEYSSPSMPTTTDALLLEAPNPLPEYSTPPMPTTTDTPPLDHATSGYSYGASILLQEMKEMEEEVERVYAIEDEKNREFATEVTALMPWEDMSAWEVPIPRPPRLSLSLSLPAVRHKTYATKSLNTTTSDVSTHSEHSSGTISDGSDRSYRPSSMLQRGRANLSCGFGPKESGLRSRILRLTVINTRIPRGSL